MNKLYTIFLLLLITTQLGAQPTIDIDADDDGLIEVNNLEILDAMRYQLDGSGLRINATAEKVTTGCAVGGCKGYELTRDLDFLDASSYRDIGNQKRWTNGAGWQPIGDSEDPFTAIFKTNNSSTPNTIFNLMINRSDEDNVGLFGHLGRAAQVSGIGLLDIQVTGRHRIGGLVGENVGGQVSNSYASGRVIGGGGTIGLLVGSNRGAITNSYADGEVSGKANSVGGLVGMNSGNISNSYAVGSVAGSANNVGGLVGDNSQGVISNSYASSHVSGSEDIGGLVGLSNLGTLIKNYVSGKASGIRYVGGLVGMNIGGTISHSYWDKTTSALNSDTGGVGLSASELQSASAQSEDLKKPFYQWSTVHWDFGNEAQYPILKYATGADVDNPACGPGHSLPNCGSLLLGQHASLKNIVLLADVTLTPKFKPARFNYHLNITPATKQLQIIPIATNPNVVIDINKNGTAIETDLASGTTSTTLTLEQNTQIMIAVSATNQRSVQYQLTVNYLPEITVTGIPQDALDEGRRIMLSASSSDAEGDVLSYRWHQNLGKALAFDATDQSILVLRIPEDYVSAHASGTELGLTLAVSDGKANVSQAIRVDINKIDNGTITVAAPASGVVEWTAPEVKLADDPDGVGDNLQYQWQSRAPDQSSDWIDIAQATQRNYTPSILTAVGTEYRVRLSYTDGQGYATTVHSKAAPYELEIVKLDSVRGQATPPTPTSTQTTTATSESDCGTANPDQITDIDEDNDGLIEICNLEGLDAMRYQLDGSGYRASADAAKITAGCAAGGCSGYELMRDLDFLDDASYRNTNNKVIWTTEEGWQPIGNQSQDFKSSFEGNGYTISHLMINRPNTYTVGLFRNITKTSRVTNISLLSVNVHGYWAVGSLVGYSSGTIMNSYATGAVTGYWNVGGLVGYGSGIIMNSYATGAVTGRSEVGGLVGYGSGIIMNSYATGAVTGRSEVGGLVGSNDYKITNSYATGAVTGHSRVGSLVGYNSSDIMNSYATGAITRRSKTGGLVGYHRYGNITNSYWDTETSGIRHGVGGIGKTTVELQSPTEATGIYDNWSSWDFGNASQYPILKVNSTLLSPALRYGLKEVRLVKGHLSPDFISMIQNYTGFAVNSSSTIQLIPIAVDPNARIHITSSGIDETINSGDTSSRIQLNENNATNITITVTTGINRFEYNLSINYYHFAGVVDKDSDGLIEIDSIEKLRAINYQLDGSGYRAGGTFPKIMLGCPPTGCIGYELTQDLSLAEDNNWLPISYFNATFEGNGNTISNLKINRPNTNHVGLFGAVLYQSRITNIGLLNVNVRGDNYVGGLVSFSDGNIINSYATGTIMGHSRVGGLVGDSDGKIIDSHATGEVKGGLRKIGGLVGDNNGEIMNSYAISAVTGRYYSTGGLVGDNTGKIMNSYATGAVTGRIVGGLVGDNTGKIMNSYATVAVKGNSYVGGLVGFNRKDSSITNSYATGAVKGNWDVGGLVGNNWKDSSITNSYATGTVRGNSNVGGLVGDNDGKIMSSYATGAVEGNSYVGGLAGLNRSGSSITNSYATGAVTGNTFVGGLVGYNYSGSIKNSYWDKQASRRGSSRGGIGKTTAQLQSPTGASGIYSKWSTANWDFGTTSQYPAIKYAEHCGAPQQPTCGTLLPGQYPNLLDDLSVNGTLSPKFNPAILSYDVTVNFDVDNLILRTTATNASIRITRNRILESTGTTTVNTEIPLTIAGPTIIIITVTKPRLRPTHYQLSVLHDEGNPDEDDFTAQGRVGDGEKKELSENKIEVQEGETFEVSFEGKCKSVCGWEVPDELASLLKNEQHSTDNLIFREVPANFVALDNNPEELTLELKFTTRQNSDGYAGNKKNSITVIILRTDNGHISVERPTLNGRSMTAPETDLLGDPDGGVQENTIQYQWQQADDVALDQPTNWSNIMNATTKTYTVANQTPYATTWYRVQISYTDGQDFCYGEVQNCEGSKSNPYIYSSAIRDIDADDDGLIEIKYLEELDAIRHQLDGSGYRANSSAIKDTTGCPPDQCIGYELVADLDFSTATSYKAGVINEEWIQGPGWEPIGLGQLMVDPLICQLKGNGYTISNLVINRTADYIGLFAKLAEGAMIDGIDLYKVNITGDDHVGALVGKNAGGIIINSGVSGDRTYTNTIVATGNGIGGLVGMNEEGSIINSFVIANVSGNGVGETESFYVGGLIGYNKGLIYNSYARAEGYIRGKSNVGGLVGQNEGDIYNSYALSTVKGDGNIGNLVGTNGGSAVIVSSYWNKEINGSSIADDDRGIGKTTEQLQSPTTATGIYRDWDAAVWDFGTENQYPALKYANQCTEVDAPAYCNDLSAAHHTFLQSLCNREDVPGDCGNLLLGQRLGLQDLALDSAILIEEFHNRTHRYNVLIDNETTSVGVILITANPSAKMKLSKGDGSQATPLNEGSNRVELLPGDSEFTIVVTDGRSEISYRLNLTRLMTSIDTLETAFAEGNAIELIAKTEPDNSFNNYKDIYQWSGDLLAIITSKASVRTTISETYVIDNGNEAIVELKVSRMLRGQQIESHTTITLQITQENNGSMNSIGLPTIDEDTWTLQVPGLPMDASDGGDPEGVKEGSLRYQWERRRFTGDEWEAINGATTRTYTIPEATFAYTEYRVIIGYEDLEDNPIRTNDPNAPTSLPYLYKVIDRDNDGLIEVRSAARLNAIRYQLDGSGLRMSATTASNSLGCPVSGCKGYELQDHIDLDHIDPSDSNWQPLGSEAEPFNTILEGNHYTISNLRITTATNYVGLFAAISENARIRNIGLLNVTITANNNVGGLVGSNAGTIVHSYVVGNRIEGNSAIGGLVGLNAGVVTTSHVIVKEIIGTARVGNDIGGLIGKSEAGVIKHSYAKVDSMEVEGSSVCDNEGSLSDKFIGVKVNTAIIKSKMVGSCTSKKIFTQE